MQYIVCVCYLEGALLVNRTLFPAFSCRPQTPLPYLCLFLRVFSGILAIQKEAKLRSKAGSGSCCRSTQPG